MLIEHSGVREVPVRRNKTHKSMNATRSHVPHGHAFTLMELLLVMAIMTVLAGVAVPRFVDSIARQRLDGAVRRLSADLKYAQDQAKISGASHKVAFDVAADTYYLQRYDSAAEAWYFPPHPDHPSSPYAVVLSEEPHQVAITSVRFGSTQEIVFDGYGMPTIDAGTGRPAPTAVTAVSPEDIVTPIVPRKDLEVK